MIKFLLDEGGDFMYQSRLAKKGDFDRLRDFAVKTYNNSDYPLNWQIDRWNFCYSVVMEIKEYTVDEWFDGIKIWFKDDEIIAIVNWEGERRGEAFIQVLHSDLPDSLFNEMLDFVELKLRSGEDFVEVRISSKLPRLIELALKRDFIKQDWEETLTAMGVTKKEISIPSGYEIIDGKSVTGLMKSDAHHSAFGYKRDPGDRERFASGFQRMMHMADYRQKLDLHMIYEGEIVAFACLWFDKANKCAVLEPVGTNKKHHKKGLAKALIYEGMNRIGELGATKLYVYSKQPFYLAIGFEPVAEWPVFRK